MALMIAPGRPEFSANLAVRLPNLQATSPEADDVQAGWLESEVWVGGSKSRPYVRFAAVSFMVVGLLSLAAGLAAMRTIGQGEQDSATDEVVGHIGLPVGAILEGSAGGSLSSTATEDLDDVIQPLLAGGLASVRVFGGDGSLFYEAGTPPDAAAPEGPRAEHGRAKIASGAEVFVVRFAQGGYTVEVAEDLAPIEGAIGRARREMIIAVTAFGAAIWLLSLGAFWYGVRTLRQAHGELTYLYDTGQQLRESLDLHDVLTRLAADATRLVHGRFGLVALIDETSGELLLKTAWDAETKSVTLHQRALDEWFVRRCIATNQTVVSGEGAERYRQYFGDIEINRRSGLLCVPLSLRDRVVGAISVVRPRRGKEAVFALSEIRIVEELAAQAVTAVEQAQLFAKVRADANELEQGYDTTLKALMAALDAKDDATEGHCERVARLTVQLARFMEVDEELLVHIERGALLHDVGKIGVPDDILKKPNSLNDGEWEAMRKHPLLAGLMVSKIGFLEPALPILLYHHERYDGTGYPFGLGGQNIPVEARIFSIIDAYDAMTSDRPYRKAMSHEAAMEEVLTNAGQQFDPNVVSAFERLIEARPELRQSAPKHLGDPHDHDDDDLPGLPDETAA